MIRLYLRPVLLLSMMFIMCSNVCVAEIPDTLNFPILIPDNGSGDNPHLSPIHSAVYGAVYSDRQSLHLFISPEIQIAYVRFYRNGLLVVTDDTPIPINNSLYYDLSSFGSGAYTVQLNAYDGTVYIGNFTL